MSKYKSQITVVDGIKFASKKEAARFKELTFLEKFGHISNLVRQVAYELNPGGTFSFKYRSDFEYDMDGVHIVEDVKGMVTREFKKKMKLMKQVHGINIKLT